MLKKHRNIIANILFCCLSVLAACKHQEISNQKTNKNCPNTIDLSTITIPDNEKWWLKIADENLIWSINQAIKNKYSTEEALQILSLQQKANINRAALLPAISENSTFDNNNEKQDKIGADSKYNIWQNIFYKKLLAARTAESCYEASDFDKKALINEIAGQLLKTAIISSNLRIQLKLQEQIIEFYQQKLSTSQQPKNTADSNLNLYLARKSLAAAMLNLKALQTQLAITTNAWNFKEEKVGTESESTQPSSSTATEFSLDKKLPAISNQLPAYLMDGRPELQFSYLAIALQKSNISIKIADLYPDLQITSRFEDEISSPNIIAFQEHLGNEFTLAKNQQIIEFFSADQKAETINKINIYNNSIANALKEIENILTEMEYFKKQSGDAKIFANVPLTYGRGSPQAGGAAYTESPYPEEIKAKILVDKKFSQQENGIDQTQIGENKNSAQTTENKVATEFRESVALLENKQNLFNFYQQQWINLVDLNLALGIIIPENLPSKPIKLATPDPSTIPFESINKENIKDKNTNSNTPTASKKKKKYHLKNRN